jgi:hypothetical protein
MHIYMSACVYTHTHTHTHAHTRTYTHIYICIYILIRTYIYIYIYTSQELDAEELQELALSWILRERVREILK